MSNNQITPGMQECEIRAVYRAVGTCLLLLAMIAGGVGLFYYRASHASSDSIDYGPIVAQADDTFGVVKVSEVVSVYDGDTFTVNIREWPDIIGSEISIRVFGVDTPEMSEERPELRKLAEEAKRFTESKLRRTRDIKLVDLRRDKYFRILARVLVDDRDLAEMLIHAGLGKSYAGGTKPVWAMSDYKKYNN